jgi:hypothetical protein
MELHEMSAEQRAQYYREQNDKRRTEAQAELLKLRADVARHLTLRLPGTTVSLASTENAALVRLTYRDTDIVYTLRFYVVARSARWNIAQHFEPSIAGDSIVINRRTKRPIYARRKDGTHNLDNIVKDYLAYVEHRTAQRTRAEASETARKASVDTFSAVLDATEIPQDPVSYTTRAVSNIGPFKVTLTPGEYSGGKVRVQVALENEYLRGEEIVALIAKLRGMQ